MVSFSLSTRGYAVEDHLSSGASTELQKAFQPMGKTILSYDCWFNPNETGSDIIMAACCEPLGGVRIASEQVGLIERTSLCHLHNPLIQIV